MSREKDDLICVVTYRLNRREPYGVFWTTEPAELTDEELKILARGIQSTLDASRKADEKPPERVM